MPDVAAYVRMSTDQQKYSIGNQMAAIEAWCGASGARLVRVYTDAGKSGLSLKNRPGLQGLIADARAGGLPFTAVAVLDVSRFGRFQNVDEGAYLEQVLKKAGAPVTYVAEAFHAESPAIAAIFKTVKRAMAAEYSRELGEKIRYSLRRRAEAGAYVSSLAGFGYRRVLLGPDGREWPYAGGAIRGDGWRAVLRLGPDEDVATVREIFRRYLAGVSLKHIAAQLTAEGWPSNRGKGWHKSTVQGIILAEKYAGTLVFGRSVSKLRRIVRRPPRAEHLRVEDIWPAIISRATWDAAQRVREAKMPRFTKAQMIKGLRRLHAREGRLTHAMIDRAPGLPSHTTVRKAFGTIKAAYAAAGLPVLTFAESVALRSKPRR